MMDGLGLHSNSASPGARDVPSLKPGRRAGAPGGYVMGGGSSLSPSIGASDILFKPIGLNCKVGCSSKLTRFMLLLELQRWLLTVCGELRSLWPVVSLRACIPCSGAG